MTKNDVQTWMTNGTIGATVLAVGRWLVKRLDKVQLGSIRYVDARYEKVVEELVQARIDKVKLEAVAASTTEQRQELREHYEALQVRFEELSRKVEELRDAKD